MGFSIQRFNVTYRQLDITKSFELSTNELLEGYEDDKIILGLETIDTDLLRYKLWITPKKEVSFERLEGIVEHQYDLHEHIFVNGYQSWTDSVEMTISGKQQGISSLAKPIIKKYALDAYGDYQFVKKPKRGQFHGFTYSYIRKNKTYQLIGSLDESMGYTMLHHNSKKNQCVIRKDLEGVTYSANDSDTLLLDLVMLEGPEAVCFDQYFELMDIGSPRFGRMSGWTSWYNYYEAISEEIILSNLEAMHQENYGLDVFQIDDGYETAVGDWLSVDEHKFPNGMNVLADKIHEKGYKAGIWLAPFVCETDSDIYLKHPSWLIRDQQGNPVKAGNNWSHFYGLDIYNEEVRQYLREVFDTVLNEWNYDMVKLDFLYAISIIPYGNRSRGQIMTDGMNFLRKLVGDKIILGCGVPLGPSFGKVDYCRIGCDVGLDWNDKWFMQKLHRERVSTYNAIKNSIYRRQLDGRAFINDPDVFLLRDNNIQLSDNEKELLTAVNDVFGNLIFTSDDVGEYNTTQAALCQSVLKAKVHEEIQVQEYEKDVLIVEYLEDMKEKKMILNLTGQKVSINGQTVEAHSVYWV
jgi:alpha-galactosidase